MSKTDSRTTLLDLLQWAENICTELSKGVRQNQFLDSFAQPIKFEIIAANQISPTAILLNLNEIKSNLTTDGTLKFGERILSGEKLHKFVNTLESTFFIEDLNGKPTVYYYHNEERVYVGHLRINKGSIAIHSRWLRKLTITAPDATQTTLQKYLNNEQAFIVTFESTEYIYLGRQIFRDRGMKTHCREIEAALIPKNFSNIKSEKGTPQKARTTFEKDSIFNFVEKKLRKKASILICDDLADEWADYIEFCKNPLQVRLLHCKHGKPSTSASQLHDVVSQAIKNIGRVSFHKEEISKKANSWSKAYSKTKIKRVRSNHSIDQIKASMEHIVKSPTYQKEISLITPFLSETELREAFNKIEKGQQIEPHLPQLIWLLSTFLTLCKESGIKPSVYCSK